MRWVVAVLLGGLLAGEAAGQVAGETEAVNAARAEVVALFQAGRFAEAEAAGAGALPGNLGASADRIAALRMWVGHAQRRQGRHAAAVAMYEAALVGRHEYQKRSGDFHSYLAMSLLALGREAEAQEALMAGLLEVVPRSPLPASAAGMFGRLRPRVLGREVYRDFLMEVLLACPATEANAEFLGRIKSELEKLQ